MPILSKDQILAYCREHKQEFAQIYGVRSMGLFGSIVRDELHESSDIDIVIEMFPDKKNLTNFFALQQCLEHEFGKKVDLGIESSLKEFIRRRIAKEIIYV